jgi:HEAT repeat protein
MKPTASISLLLESLNEESGTVRYHVESVLKQMTDSISSDLLINILNNIEHNGRYAAARLLEKKADPSTAEELIRKLNDDDIFIRYSAAMTLTKIGTANTLQPLLHILDNNKKFFVNKEKMDQLEYKITEALGKIGDQKAVGALVKLAEHKKWDVRNMAFKSLMRIDSDDTIEHFLKFIKEKNEQFLRVAQEEKALNNDRYIIPLIQILEDDKLIKYGTEVLANFGEEAVQPLIKKLKSSTSYGVNKAIVWTLWKTGIDSVVPILVDTLSREDVPTIHTLKILQEIGWEPEGDTEHCWFLIGTEKWDELTKLGSNATDFLVLILKDPEAVLWKISTEDRRYSSKVSELLGKIGNNKATAALLDALSIYSKAKDSILRYLSWDFAYALMEAGKKEYADKILEFIYSECFSVHYMSYQEVPDHKCPDVLNSYFGDYGAIIYNSVQYYIVTQPEDRDLDSVSTHYVKSNQINAVKELCKLKTAISTNILHKFLEHHDKSKLFEESIGLVESELDSRGNPQPDPSAYKENNSWTIKLDHLR